MRNDRSTRLAVAAHPYLASDLAPPIGRIVVYTLPAHEPALSGARIMPAIVTGIVEVATGVLINLRVFFDGPPRGDEWRTVIPFAEQPGVPGTWAWPKVTHES